MPKTRDDQMVAHREVLKATYRTWVNDFLTLGELSLWLGVSREDASRLLLIGKRLQEEDADNGVT